ncbi:hypothetical protein RFI_05391 [Reticulomyxa filosa]|uniref:Uncharacterized protein n=1 Tax=Reticulomyxa filosa TaxID=46433 RepID=X6P0S0_RETFI|nr:hypothetical protein RFI_05391 [Reticulomyxa filosa]|eukprot:ETO31728.1 hypothetical protein RFI_05391 [Reticulomyxa filosa]
MFVQDPVKQVKALQRFDALADQLIKEAPVQNMRLVHGKNQAAYYFPSASDPEKGVIVVTYDGKKTTMMAAPRKFYNAEELLTTFKVVKVETEFIAESKWTLQFEDYEPITYFEKYGCTRIEDERLGGKMIKVQVNLFIEEDHNIEPVLDPKEQKKTMFYVEEPGHFIAVGVYMDDVYEDNDTDYVRFVLDSIYKVVVGKNLVNSKFNLKKGDWVRVKGTEGEVDPARKYIPIPCVKPATRSKRSIVSMLFRSIDSMNIAEKYIEAENWGLAEKTLLKTIKNAPNDSIAHSKLCKVYRNQGKLELAEKEALMALALNSDDGFIHFKA